MGSRECFVLSCLSEPKILNKFAEICYFKKIQISERYDRVFKSPRESQEYVTLSDLSESTSPHYSRIIVANKKIQKFREVFPHQFCPICPLFFGWK